MRKSKKMLSSMLVLSFVFSLMLGTTVFAKEAEAAAVTATEARAGDTIVGPDGNVYYYLGTADRQSNRPVEAMLSQTIAASDKAHIAFYCPNNGRKDLIQGKVTATPVLGGTVQTYSFINFYNEISVIDLSNLPGVGRYRINITVHAIGTSNKGAVYYRIY